MHHMPVACFCYKHIAHACWAVRVAAICKQYDRENVACRGAVGIGTKRRCQHHMHLSDCLQGKGALRSRHC